MSRSSIPGGRHAGVRCTAQARDTSHQGESVWGSLDYLMKALASGAAPSLSQFYHDQPDFDVSEVEDLVGMAEARARRADCKSIRR